MSSRINRVHLLVASAIVVLVAVCSFSCVATPAGDAAGGGVSGGVSSQEQAESGSSMLQYVLAAPCLNPDGVEVKIWPAKDITIPEGTNVRLQVGKHSIQIPYGKRLFLPLPGAPRWTPDTPNLLKLKVSIGSEEKTVRFGLRLVTAVGEKLFLNGQPFYARGFGCDGNGDGQLKRQVSTVQGFRNYVKRAKQFGFNTMRSHMPSNDRPQAFLDACDELGLLMWPEFEVELDNVSQLAYYWNHPSVMWWCWGNEIGSMGSSEWAKKAYAFAHETDPSRLVQDNSGWSQYDRLTTDIVNQHMGYYFPYGARATCYSSYGLFTAEGSVQGRKMEDIMQEMRDGKFRVGKPTLAHETGNHQTFPDFQRRADRMNFSARPALLKKFQTGDRIKYLDRWVEGSGKYKQAMDKVWIEQVRKSPIVEGYEMWMLADHGYAFGGVIEDGEDCRIKPFVSPAFFRAFNAADVLLADFPDSKFKNFKCAFLPGEKFKIRLMASVYGPNSIKPGIAVWTLTDKGRVLSRGKSAVLGADRGRVSVLGDITITTPKTKVPLELKLRVTLPNTKNALANEWGVWVYPQTNVPVPGKLLVVKELTDSTMDALANGARVLLILEDTKNIGRADQAFPSAMARFRPQMWEWGHNLGAYVSNHPALKGFPNSGFSDMQFFNPIDYGRKIILDDCPFAPDPIIDAIDIPFVSDSPEPYMRKATYLFELGVGKGKILVTGFNFTDENLKNLEVRALLKSLEDYANSAAFKPKKQVDPSQFGAYVKGTKKNPILGGEGYWDKIFYYDTELAGRNKFLDAGEEPPYVKATPSPVKK